MVNKFFDLIKLVFELTPLSEMIIREHSSFIAISLNLHISSNFFSKPIIPVSISNKLEIVLDLIFDSFIEINSYLKES